MFGYHDVLNLSITAAGPIAAGKFVDFAGMQAGADVPVFGWAQTDQVAGREVSCTVLGAVPVKAGGPIARGAKVVSNAAGDAVDAGAGVNVVGRALNAAAVGEQVRVLLGR